MCKWRNIFNTLLLGMLLLSAAGHAQGERLERAQDLYRSQQSELALQVIDSALTHPETRDDYSTWTIRAFIYFDLYKRSDRLKLHSALRDSIVSSVLRSQQLKPDSIFTKQNRSLLFNLAAGYYNMGKSYLEDSLDYDKSKLAYDRYRETYALAEPDADFRQRDVEYNLAAGSLHLDLFLKDKNNTRAREIAKLTLMRVLEIQPENPGALVNMGLMYYNQAAYLSQSLPYDADFSTLDVVQEDMVKLAKQAEQFIVKAYEQDNQNVKAVEALFYIYRMLHEIPRSDEFKAKCKEFGIDVEQTATTK